MCSDERSILTSLCEGKISFSDAANMLNVSKEIVEEMLESFKWMPSSTRITELCDSERQTLSDICIESAPVTSRSPSFTYRYESIGFGAQVVTKTRSFGTSVTDVPRTQEDVVVTHRGNSSRYKICN